MRLKDCKNFVPRRKYILLVCCFICCLQQAALSQDTTRVVDSLPPVPRFKTFRVQSLTVPAALIFVGSVGNSDDLAPANQYFQKLRNNNFPSFKTHIDNYLQYAPAALGYAMLISNGDRDHRFWKYTEKLLLSEAIMNAFVQPLKHFTKQTRPDGSDQLSFPSGHTANAFTSATIFVDEFARNKPWLAATVYAGASTVGVLRVLNNKHWAGDVLAGAGFGILSAKLAEWIVEPHGRKKPVTTHL